jgi:hypothetical protein
MHKKGISAVVATILIVLLAVVAVVIIWAVLRPAITKSASQVSASCVEVDVNIDSVTCATGVVTVTLAAGSVNNLAIVESNATASLNNTVTAPPTLGTRTYTLTGTIPAGATVVRVAPIIILSDGSSKICENYESKTC